MIIVVTSVLMTIVTAMLMLIRRNQNSDYHSLSSNIAIAIVTLTSAIIDSRNDDNSDDINSNRSTNVGPCHPM